MSNIAQETDIVYEGLQLWLQITGHDPEANRLYLSEMHLRSGCNELKESQELDDTGITTAMLLGIYLKEYEEDRTFSLKQLLSNDEGMLDCVQNARKLKALLASPRITKHVEAYRASLHKVLSEYKIDDVHKMVGDDTWISVIRRNALRSMRDLKEHQFLKGEFSSEHPKFIPDILQAWNVNSLLEIGAGMPGNCISLCLMRTEQPELSYFVFMIKNNSNIWILTDKETGAHPMSQSMSRRKDRDLEKRILKNHFPYQLLEMEWGEKHVSFKNVTALAPRQVEAYRMKAIRELYPDQIIWITLMMDLIKGKYFKQRYESPQLSYTAEMIKEPMALLKADSVSYLPVKGYQPLEMKPLTLDDVTTEKLTDWDMDQTKQHEWLEKRYIDKVKEEHLNLLAHKGEIELSLDVSRTAKPWMDKTHDLTLKAANPSEFGDKDALEKYRVWFARHNLATAIKKYAIEEFNKREQEIRDWYKAAVEKNMPTLLKGIGDRAIYAPRKEVEEGIGFGDRDKPYPDKRENLLDMYTCRHAFYNTKEFWFARSYVRKGDFHACYVNGARSSYVARIAPELPQDLAVICGCKIKDLPDVLQHWTVKEKYYGNNLLNDIDPMEWAIDNPWRAIQFEVYIALSKSGLKSLNPSSPMPDAED